MRFSTLFQPPAPQAPAEDEPVCTEAAPSRPAGAVPQELPEALDERVRLLGEWQLLEG